MSTAALKYSGVVRFVRVDEDEVERLTALILEGREAVERRSDAYLDLALQPGARDVPPRHPSAW